MNNLMENLKKILPLLEKYKKYICVCGLFVVMVLTLYFFTGEEYVANRLAEMNSKPVSGEDYVPDDEFEVDQYAELNELIATYFDAYVNADFETLKEIATPISEMEESYISTMCQYYEEYQNVTCYTKHGLSKDSFIVSACFDIKFVDLEVVAPSMVLFYVQTNEDGELYINNLYSDFNMQYSELAINRDVYTALRKYTTQDDYLELYNLVEAEFNQLIKDDEDIYVLTKRTIPAMRQEWEDTVYYAHDDSETETETGTEAGTEGGTESGTEVGTEPGTEVGTETGTEPGTQVQQPETQTPSTEEPTTQTPEPVKEYVRIIDSAGDVNVRETPKPNGKKLGKADAGDVFEKLGDGFGDDGSWTKINYDNQIAYVATRLLEPADAPTTEATE